MMHLNSSQISKMILNFGYKYVLKSFLMSRILYWSFVWVLGATKLKNYVAVKKLTGIIDY